MQNDRKEEDNLDSPNKSENDRRRDGFPLKDCGNDGGGCGNDGGGCGNDGKG